jgi:hypothetical protein
MGPSYRNELETTGRARMDRNGHWSGTTEGRPHFTVCIEILPKSSKWQNEYISSDKSVYEKLIGAKVACFSVARIWRAYITLFLLILISINDQVTPNISPGISVFLHQEPGITQFSPDDFTEWLQFRSGISRLALLIIIRYLVDLP